MKYLLTGETSERLAFRLLEENDFETWLPFFENKDVTNFLAMDSTKSKVELCEFWFEKVFARYNNDLGGMNVLIDQSTGQFVGQCGLLVQDIESQSRLEIGYSLLPEFWGKGYATEAAIKCKEFAFKNNFSESLISIIHPSNIPSQKVAINNDMSFKREVDGGFHGMQAHLYEIQKP